MFASIHQWNKNIGVNFTVFHTLICVFSLDLSDDSKKRVHCQPPLCACQKVENRQLVGDIFCCSDVSSTAELEGFPPHTAQNECHPPWVAACINPVLTFHCCPAMTTTTTTTAAPTPAPAVPCFPAAAKVNFDSGKSVTMAELQIGDHVQTGRTLNLIISIIF